MTATAGQPASRPIRSVVGNDVVDLSDPAIASHHLRDRFVRRVCSSDEQRRVSSAADLWSIFAAKEAAYKALVKCGHAPGFAHRQIEVTADLRAVHWHGHPFELRVVADGESVHAVAWTRLAAHPIARVARVTDLTRVARVTDLVRIAGVSEGESAAARALACDIVAAAIGCAAEELEVVRDPLPGGWDGYGPPRIERRGAPIDADISLSHDGRFVAAAATVPERAD